MEKYYGYLGPPRRDHLFGIVFSDIALNMLGAFLIMMIVLMNPISKKKEGMADIPFAGGLLFEADWLQTDPKTQKPIDVDVDLWVQCGKDTPPIGYSNKGDVRCNYLRDDLGTTYDPQDKRNDESTWSRGLVPGQYCMNGHLYSNRWGELPIPVRMTVKMSKDAPVDGSSKGDVKKILDKTIELNKVGHELNAFCFFIDEKGDYDEKKTFQSDAVCLRSPVDYGKGTCANTSMSAPPSFDESGEVH